MSQKKLLVIGYLWPEPKSSAAGARMMQLLEFFAAEKYDITFASTATKTEFKADLSHLNISERTIDLNNDSFDHFLAEISPEIVIFDRFMVEEQFGWRVAEVCPKALRILDTEDLHFLRKAREEAAKAGKDVAEANLFSDVAKREVASIYRCDLSLIISKAEMELLQNHFRVPEQILFYLPFMLKSTPPKKIKALRPYQERKDFMSIGNFLHEPNKDAVLQLKKEIWPLIRKKIKGVKIHIFGAYVPQQILQLNNEKEGFIVHGRATSAKEEIEKARVLLAPLRFGAGIKGKFTDAMQVGTPSVTTTLGEEGMSHNLNWNGMIANSAGAFSEAAVALYQNEDLWSKAQAQGFEILEQNFSEAIHRERFRRRIQELSRALNEHRNSNFTGLMLQHHSMSSTKYLSKYITAKNKNRP
ncbi:glycosyltransferase family 4 protein [Salinimicrobium oceani]|uniref:Glycosyltransferase family 4 protein n=1 Tax=Salinimicrobium oceani TaxID=2722702 RepID=A0ABX1CYJ6_9FLAO|nr:glycosyltransferase family 4 protein [Salinimicrobium oceani]NJW53337.1 glycosyltransferase family 4 protein [Salinimicrobium oceani]